MPDKKRRVDPYKNFNFHVMFAAAVAGAAAFFTVRRLTKRRD